jgi:hypothetical protein
MPPPSRSLNARGTTTFQSRARPSGQAQFLSFHFAFSFRADFTWNATGARAFLLSSPAGKYLQLRECFEKRGSPRTPLPRSFSAAGFVSHSRRQLLAKRCHRASILTCKERDDCSHNDPYSGEPCSCLCPPKRILLQFFRAVSGRLVLFPEPTLYVAARILPSPSPGTIDPPPGPA